MQQHLTKLEIMCAQMQDDNEKLLREASQHKREEIRQVLKLGEEADKLSSVGDHHAAEQCYLQALNILPQHAQSLCNYAYLLQTGKKELDRTEEFLDKVEELYKKALQAEPHRAATQFNYAGYFHKCGRVREGREMYARARELEPTHPFIQAFGHLFQDAEDVRSITGVLAASEPQPVEPVQFNVLVSATQCSTPDMYRQRLTLSPAGIYKTH
jgi:tetratricopeptide (TPR) repeat protein